MTVSLPQVNNSWLTQLGNSLTQAMGSQNAGNNYFPPAPSAGGAAQQQPQMTAMPAQSGGFLQSLMQKMPGNQAAANQYQIPPRIGG